jgi:predicted O-linked N-acetylglucosamine transferase (SPINDLY family)
MNETQIKQWQQQAEYDYQNNNYHRAATLYEQLITEFPKQKLYFWQLGLMLLLQGNVAEAQTTWFMAMLDGNSQQVTQWNGELRAMLNREVDRQESLDRRDIAWQICRQLQELFPEDIHHHLRWLQLGLELRKYISDHLQETNLRETLQADIEVEFDLFVSVLYLLLLQDCLNPEVLKLAAIGLKFAKTLTQKEKIGRMFHDAALNISRIQRQYDLGIRIYELGLQATPQNYELIADLSGAAQDVGDYEKGIKIAQHLLSISESLPARVFAQRTLLKALMATGGNWLESLHAAKEHQELLQQLLQQQPTDLTLLQITRLINTCFFSPYLDDCPQENRATINQVSKLCQKNIQILEQEKIQRYQQGHQKRLFQRRSRQKLRIGYVSYCLSTHSVGWLVRSLMQYHDRDRFELYGYLLSSPERQDTLQDWYVTQFQKTVKSMDAEKIAEIIFEDEIDILIELDSLTIDLACYIVSLKPAPIQVTWLGWDASGIPTVDYFIADPYVLPDRAQNYYQEKIWRLPQTYIACGGFETALPTLRRETLEIPKDAVIYYSVQRGYKRHLNTSRLQLKIIKGVPNSYFLIKGCMNSEKIKDTFYRLAEEEGIERDRLRFLDLDTNEAIHRGNLGIADVVLDTYPYNGATTTMETLWIGIPLVTRVGQQFAARNSYTMLTNIGVKEGIAWTDEEYLAWGIRFGLDESLRQKVSWQMKKARYTQPLWDSKAFTREMENAYQEMWNIYLNSSESSRT